MITPPRRSVTRFFIPLIDVLILLFCIFLLMPFVSGPAQSEASAPTPTPKEPLPDNVRDLQRELSEARARIDRLEKAAQARITDRLIVRVLNVGRDRNGVFLYYFNPERQEIRTATDALKLIDQQKAIAVKAGGVKDMLFLILYPRDAAGNPADYPDAAAEQLIHKWFQDVPHKFE